MAGTNTMSAVLGQPSTASREAGSGGKSQETFHKSNKKEQGHQYPLRHILFIDKPSKGLRSQKRYSSI